MTWQEITELIEWIEWNGGCNQPSFVLFFPEITHIVSALKVFNNSSRSHSLQTMVICLGLLVLSRKMCIRHQGVSLNSMLCKLILTSSSKLSPVTGGQTTLGD